MVSKQKRWIYNPPGKPKAKVPDVVKCTLLNKANELIESVLKPNHIKPPPKDNTFNYIVDIYSKWYRNYFYFKQSIAVLAQMLFLHSLSRNSLVWNI